MEKIITITRACLKMLLKGDVQGPLGIQLIQQEEGEEQYNRRKHPNQNNLWNLNLCSCMEGDQI